MHIYKILLGVLTVVLTVIAYIPYIRDVLKKKTKPHIFTWLIWSILTGIAFVAQVVGGGGSGAWATASVAIVDLVIFILSVSYGDRRFSPLDWTSLVAALFAIFLWILTENPLFSVVLITGAAALGFIPTFHKSFSRPNEETLLTYTLNTFKQGLSLVALKSVTATTAVFPAALVLLNGALSLFIFVRRKQKA